MDQEYIIICSKLNNEGIWSAFTYDLLKDRCIADVFMKKNIYYMKT